MSGHQRILACCLLSFAVGCQADGSFKNPFSRAEHSTADTRDSRMKLPEFRRRKTDELKTLDREKPLIASEQLDRLLQEGQTSLQQRELEKAKTAYEEVLEYEPENATAHHGLAMTADLEEKYADAELHYKKALHVRPRDANLLSDIGYSYILQNRYDEAARYLNQAIEVNPQHEYAHLNLALLDLKQGKKAAAEQRLVQLYGQGGQVVQTLAQLQEQAGLPVDTAVSTGSLVAGIPDLPPNATLEQAQELARLRRQEAERARQLEGIPNGLPNGIPNAMADSATSARQQPIIPTGYPQPAGNAGASIQVAPGPQWPAAQQPGAVAPGMAANGMPGVSSGINTQSGISIQPGFFGAPGTNASAGSVSAPIPNGPAMSSGQSSTQAGMPMGQPSQNPAPSWPSSFSMPTTQGTPGVSANGVSGNMASPAQWPSSISPGATGQTVQNFPNANANVNSNGIAPNGMAPNMTAMNPNSGPGIPGTNAPPMGNVSMPAGWNTAPMAAQNGANAPGPGSASPSNGLVPIHSTGAFSQPASPVSYGNQAAPGAPNAGTPSNGQIGGLRLEGLNFGPGSLFPVGMSEPSASSAPAGSAAPGAAANYGTAPGNGMMAPAAGAPGSSPMMGPGAANGTGMNSPAPGVGAGLMNGFQGAANQAQGTAADIRMGNVASAGSNSMVNGAMYAAPTSVLPAQEWMNQMNAAKAAAAGQGTGVANNAPGVSAPWPAARPAAPTGLDAYDRQREQMDQQYNNTLQQMNRQFPSSTQAKY